MTVTDEDVASIARGEWNATTCESHDDVLHVAESLAREVRDARAKPVVDHAVIVRAVQDVLTANAAGPTDELTKIAVYVTGETIARRAAELAGVAVGLAPAPFTAERRAAASAPGALAGGEVVPSDRRTPEAIAEFTTAMTCSFWDWPGNGYSNAELVYRAVLGATRHARAVAYQNAVLFVRGAVYTVMGPPHDALADHVAAEFAKTTVGDR